MSEAPRPFLRPAAPGGAVASRWVQALTQAWPTDRLGAGADQGGGRASRPRARAADPRGGARARGGRARVRRELRRARRARGCGQARGGCGGRRRGRRRGRDASRAHLCDSGVRRHCPPPLPPRALTGGGARQVREGRALPVRELQEGASTHPAPTRAHTHCGCALRAGGGRAEAPLVPRRAAARAGDVVARAGALLQRELPAEGLDPAQERVQAQVGGTGRGRGAGEEQRGSGMLTWQRMNTTRLGVEHR
jgi:hypothetical protein